MIIKNIVMLFAYRIRRLRNEKRMLQWQFVAIMDIDAPLFSKIERGECHAIPKQVIAIAKIFKVNRNDFLTHWLADQVTVEVDNEKELSNDVLKIAKQNINKDKI